MSCNFSLFSESARYFGGKRMEFRSKDVAMLGGFTQLKP
jgi:hypothetical protein